MLLQPRVNGPIVLAHMQGVPAIAARRAVREGRVLALERRVATAQDGLPQVFEAVRQVARHLRLDVCARRQAGEDLDDVVQAVQLVRDRRGEDGHVAGVAFESVREVVVLGGVLHLDEA